MTDEPALNQITMKIKLMIATALLAVTIILFLYAVPYFLNNKKYTEIFVKELSEFIIEEVSVTKESEFSINPFLNKLDISFKDFVIKGLESNNNKDSFYAKDVVVSFRLTDIIAGNYNIRALKINDATINAGGFKRSLDVDALSTKVQSKENGLYYLNKIEVTNSTLEDTKFFNLFSFTQLNLTINKKTNGAVKILASAYDNQYKMVNVFANINAKNQQNIRPIELSVKNDKNSMNIVGNLSVIEKKLSFNGGFKTRVVQPSLMISELVIFIPALNSILKEELTDAVLGSGDLFVDSHSLIIKNLKSISKGIEVYGNFAIFGEDNESRNRVSCDLDFIQLNLNHFFDYKEDTQAKSTEQDIQSGFFLSDVENKFINFSILDKIQLDLKVTSKELLFRDLSILDTKINLNSQEGQIKEGGVSFIMNSKDSYSKTNISNLELDKVNEENFIIGDFVHEGNNINETLDLFGLKEYLTLKQKDLNYKISSKIIFAPKEVSLFDLKGEMDKHGSFTGSVATKKEVLTDYSFDIKFDNLKLTDFGMPIFKERAQILLDKSGDDNYYSYFRWFRALSATYNVRLEFNNTELGGEKIENFVNLVKFEPGIASFKGEIKSGFAEGEYDIEVLSKEITPSLSVSLVGDNLDFNRLNNLLSGFFKDEDDVSKELKDETAEIKPEIWSSKDFNFFKIQKIKSKFDLELKNIQFGKKNIKNYRFVGHSFDEVLYVENLYLDIYGGAFQARGNISFFDKNLYQFSFSASNIEPKRIFMNLIPNFDSIAGQASLTGSFITQGNNPKEIVERLKASVNFLSPRLEVSGINADVVVDIALKRSHIEKESVLNDLDVALHQGETDIMDVNGSFSIKDGILEAKDTSFRTRFSNAAFVMSLDLNSLLMSSDVRFSFMPYNTQSPMIYSISNSGSLNKDNKAVEDTSSLLSFVKKQYNITSVVKSPEKEVPNNDENIDESSDTNVYLYRQFKKREN
jgi:hypothetical protein